MKFTDGYWLLRDGVRLIRAKDIDRVDQHGDGLTAYAAAKQITSRGDTLNQPVITVHLSAPAPDVIRVRIEHFAGALDLGPHFELTSTEVTAQVRHAEDASWVELVSGRLSARVATSGPWHLEYRWDGELLTSSTERSIAHATVEGEGTYVHEQLGLGVGETVYGLGERFGAFVKNGQTVDVWNADGGTNSEQAYKNVPFLLSSRGYGVFVDDAGPVSFEVGSENVSATQFSVPGERLTYEIYGGGEPAAVLERFTARTGRPPQLPDWSYGLWLSTSFTTDYDEATVLSFVDGMLERGIDLSVFHFDTFWMRGYHWCDFVWDPQAFPDPRSLLAKLHERGLKVCLWINPYIGQQGEIFAEAAREGYLLRRPDGSIYQSDLWQAGMGIVDFTNPAAVAWYQGKLAALLEDGVDCFKSDFGERIPTDVVWHDGSDPVRMHNYYAHLYNKVVFEVLEERRGEGEAVLFARTATAGGQQFPVHWGGDCESTFEAMAQSLRGGLSLVSSGFGYWSHDIGGFEGTPDPAVFKRWVAFGLLSSHSRLHGSNSYRVPWLFDQEAVEITRGFTRLKQSLMPYLREAAEETTARGIPMMRPMALQFPADPSCRYLDRQYMLGADLLVAPVFTADGTLEFYLPEGAWVHVLDGEQLTGGRWYTRSYGFDSLGLFARAGAPVLDLVAAPAGTAGL